MAMNIARLFALGAAAATTCAAATLLLPRHVVVERSAHVSATPEAVLSMASSTDGYQRFNPYRSTEPNLQITAFGPAAGVGSGFHFVGKDTTGSQTVSAVHADRVEYALDLGAMGQPTQSLRAADDGQGGALVTWTMHADLGINPLARVMGLMMDSFVGPTFEAGLANIDSVLKV
jgi:carbon monoxide dehydrogenase subunit G